MEAEQAKHPGKCLYHLTKSHPTCDCYIKKECEELVATRKPEGLALTYCNWSTNNIKEELDEEIVDDDITDTFPESNDTNEKDLFLLSILKITNYN